MKSETRIRWAVISNSELLFDDSIRFTRKESIAAFLKGNADYYPWEHYKQRRFRAVKITISWESK